MTTPEEQPTVGDFLARLEFKYDNDVLDFLKTGKGVVVVEDKVANIPLPKGAKGDKGDIGQLREGDVRYFNRRTEEAEAAAEASEASAGRAKASETKAKTSETNAKASETNAKASETKAKTSETNAKASETNAKASETKAKASETEAARQAGLSAGEAAAALAHKEQTGRDRTHVDGQKANVDSQVEHVSSQKKHVDDQVKHVDSQREHIDTTTAEFATESTQAFARVESAATRAEDAQAEVELVVEDSAGAIREHVKDDADRADRSATKAAEHEAGAGRAAAEATKAEVEKLTAGAPEAFDTLKEISDELEKNETERAALATTIGKKADTDYVDEQDRKIFQEDVIFEGELDQGDRIFPLRTSVNGTISIEVEWDVTQEYKDAGSSSSLSLWTVKMHDRDGNVVTGRDHEGAISGMSYTAAGGPGHGYYSYKGPERVGETVTSTHSVTVDPEYFISEFGITNWTRSTIPGLVVRKVTISAVSQTTDVMGQKVNRVEVYDNQRAISDSRSGGQLLRLNPDGHIWIGTAGITNAHHATNKSYVDEKVKEKADKGHTHESADITGTTHWVGGNPSEGHAVVKTDRDGNIYVRTTSITTSGSVTNKAYVDTEVGKKADTEYVDQGLGKKSDTGHTHGSSEITDTVYRAGTTASARKVISTSSTGRLYYDRAPGTSDELVNREYVDQELSKKADSETVNKRPALFHGHGPPGVIEGAVPGDKYMDLDEMEIYVLPEENA